MSRLKYRAWVLLAACITLHIVISRASDKYDKQAYQRLGKRDASEPDESDAQWYYQWYASSSPAARPFVFIALLLILSFLFSFIGITASDFFCPNLSTIASYLGLNESTAGVTFLAFGNGSPDVFSTFSALKNDTFGLAIGELIGAATFIVSIVVGTIALIRPFHVPRHAFIRDVTFFTAASVLLIAVLHDGRLSMLDSGALVLLYTLYVAVVILGNWYTRRRKAREAKSALDWMNHEADRNAAGVAANLRTPARRFEDAASLHSAHSMSPHSSRSASPMGRPRRGSRLHSHHDESIDTPRANFSLLGAVEFRDVVRQLRKESESANQSPAGANESDDYFGDSVGHIYGHHRRVASFTPSSRTRKVSGRPRAESYTGTLADVPASPDDSDAVSDHSLNPWTDQQGAGAVSPGAHNNNLLTPDMRPTRPRVKIPERSSSRRVPSISVTDPSGLVNEAPEADQRPLTPPIPNESRLRVRRTIRRVLRVLFPSMQSFRHKSFVGQFLATVSALPILALTLTLPVVDDGSQEGGVALPMSDAEPLDVEQGFELEPEEDAASDDGSDRLLTADVGEELHHLVEGGFSPLHSPLGRISHSTLRKLHGEHGSDHGSEIGDDEIGKEIMCELHNEEALEFHKSLTAAQCVCGPAWIVLVMFRGNSHFKVIILASVIAGLVAGAGVLAYASDGSSKPWRLVRCFAGFVCSMVWIAAIADEVVDVLQAIGEILGLSDAIIGLTIFAVGNSLADLVANVTVAQFAPAMAYAACFGGPMLNILLGVGGSGTYLMLAHPSKSPVTLHFSPTLWVSASGLVLILITTAIFVPLNGYLIDRRWAMGLIAGYCTLMTVNVLVEIKTGQHGKDGSLAVGGF